VFVQDKPVGALLAANAGSVSPVEYLLIAVASCFALSLEIARKARGWPECSFDVTSAGTKAPDAPSRLERISLEVSLTGPLDERQMATLVAEAKSLCTVTNTLTSAHTVDVKITTTATS
jgi:uncharacterized OsmC-like protein